MRILGNTLLGIGAVGFAIGAITRLLDAHWMFVPGTYWRGAMGCAAFTIALLLMEIRDRSAPPA